MSAGHDPGSRSRAAPEALPVASRKEVLCHQWRAISCQIRKARKQVVESRDSGQRLHCIWHRSYQAQLHAGFSTLEKKLQQFLTTKTNFNHLILLLPCWKIAQTPPSRSGSSSPRFQPLQTHLPSSTANPDPLSISPNVLPFFHAMKLAVATIIFTSTIVAALGIGADCGDPCDPNPCEDGKTCQTVSWTWPCPTYSCCCYQEEGVLQVAVSDACGGCADDEVCAIADPALASHSCVAASTYPSREDATRFANPRFPGYGYQVIAVNPNPAVTYSNTHIDVEVGNSGANAASGIHVQLAFNDWGLSFNGWQPIGTEVVSGPLPPATSAIVGFDHVFLSAAHTCLQAKITQVDAGGNTILTDDSAQINLEVISCHGDGAGDASFAVPLRNDGDEPIDVLQPRIFCLPQKRADPKDTGGKGDALRRDSRDLDTFFDIMTEVSAVPSSWVGNNTFSRTRADALAELYPCPDTVSLRPVARSVIQDPAGNGNSRILEHGGLRLEPFSAVDLEISATLEDDSPLHVVVETADISTGELSQVVVVLMPTTVEEILNAPNLCCIESVRTRVMLERIIAEALDAYQNGNCRAVFKLLRLFVQKVGQLLCELTEEEKACLERTIALLVDAARMLAVERGAKRVVAPRFTMPPSVPLSLQEGDRLRLQGLQQAAINEYSKACWQKYINSTPRPGAFLRESIDGVELYNMCPATLCAVRNPVVDLNITLPPNLNFTDPEPAPEPAPVVAHPLPEPR